VSIIHAIEVSTYLLYLSLYPSDAVMAVQPRSSSTVGDDDTMAQYRLSPLYMIYDYYAHMLPASLNDQGSMPAG